MKKKEHPVRTRAERASDGQDRNQAEPTSSHCKAYKKKKKIARGVLLLIVMTVLGGGGFVQTRKGCEKDQMLHHVPHMSFLTDCHRAGAAQRERD